MQTGVKSMKANTRSEKINNPKTTMETTHRLNCDKQNQYVLLNYVQTLNPPDSLHKSQERTKTQHQLTINTKWNVAFEKT